jgi:hypothetical protein
MTRPRATGVAGCALSLLAAACPFNARAAEPERCNGKKVDISANRETIRGTDKVTLCSFPLNIHQVTF